MELSFLTSENIIKAGEVVAILTAIFAIVYIVKMFLNKLGKFEEMNNERQAESNKLFGNHLEHQLTATEKLAEAIGKFSEKLDNFIK